MKKILLFPLFVLSVITVISQNSNTKGDIILKMNGDEMIGHVSEINDTDIKFVHQGESLVYTIKRMDIMKITFASGRIEFFNKPPLPSEAGKSDEKNEEDKKAVQGNLMEHHNKVAVLPFKYLVDKRDAGEEMTYKVQTEAYNYLEKNNVSLDIQDPNTTNALLIKAGINNDNQRGFTMGEICNILGVEYVIQGTITQDKTYATNTQTSNTNNKYNSSNSNNNKSGTIGNIFKSNSQSTTTTSSSSVQNYKTNIIMNVFNDKGHSIFNQNHDSFWTSNDAYKITLQYLIKRTPVFKR